MKPFEIVSEARILDKPYCVVDEQLVRFPSGQTGHWWLRRGHDVIVVLPVLKDGRVVLQRNYKHGAGRVVTELCAGVIDPGETPKTACARELGEELGLVAAGLKHVHTFYSSPTGSDVRYFCFVAEGCAFATDTHFDEAEQIEPLIMNDLEAAKAVLLNPETHTSAATLSCFLCAYNQRKSNC